MGAETLRVIAAGDDRSHPAQMPVVLGGPGFGHPSDCDEEQADWDDEGDE